jgi:hypothetical protein
VPISVLILIRKPNDLDYAVTFDIKVLRLDKNDIVNGGITLGAGFFFG